MAKMMRCPSCGQEYPLSAKLSGKKVRCKKCQQVFQVPVLPPETPAAAPAAADLSPLASGMGNLMDEELMASRPTTDENPFASGSTLPPPPTFNTLPKQSANKLGKGFVVKHKLMLAVAVAALLLFIVCSLSGLLLLGVIGAAAGLGIAAFGLLPYPKPNTSQAGAWFALASAVIVLFNYVRSYLALPQSPAEQPAPVLIGFIAGVLIGLAITGAVIAAVAFAMRRFGFFRPAAWVYIAWCIIIIPVATIVASMPAINTANPNTPANSSPPPPPVNNRPPFHSPEKMRAEFDRQMEADRKKWEEDSRKFHEEHQRRVKEMQEESRRWREKMEEENKKFEEEMNQGFGPGGMPGFGPDGEMPEPDLSHLPEEQRKFIEEQREHMKEQNRKIEEERKKFEEEFKRRRRENMGYDESSSNSSDSDGKNTEPKKKPTNPFEPGENTEPKQKPDNPFEP